MPCHTMTYHAIPGDTIFHKADPQVDYFLTIASDIFCHFGQLFSSFRFVSFHFVGCFLFYPSLCRVLGIIMWPFCRYVVGDTCPLSPKSAPSRTSTCLAVYALPLRAKLKCVPWARVGVEVGSVWGWGRWLLEEFKVVSHLCGLCLPAAGAQFKTWIHLLRA